MEKVMGAEENWIIKNFIICTLYQIPLGWSS
jgi:hypothetical protein